MKTAFVLKCYRISTKILHTAGTKARTFPAKAVQILLLISILTITVRYICTEIEGDWSIQTFLDKIFLFCRIAQISSTRFELIKHLFNVDAWKVEILRQAHSTCVLWSFIKRSAVFHFETSYYRTNKQWNYVYENVHDFSRRMCLKIRDIAHQNKDFKEI